VINSTKPTIIESLHDLEIYQWRILGNDPVNEEEFIARFRISVGVDGNGTF
jgi:hypothetical protein